MHFNDTVDRAVVDAILESSLWSKAHIDVRPRKLTENSDETDPDMFEGGIGTIPEFENRVANKYEEPVTIEGEEETSFTLDDLQLVLDNLDDDDLMEHALTMLDVFDVAYDTINEEEDEEDEEDELEEDTAKKKVTKKKSAKRKLPEFINKNRPKSKVWPGTHADDTEM